MVDGDSWLWYDSVLRSIEGALRAACGWWCCIEAKSAKVSIPGVDGCLEGGRSVAGGVPLPPLMLGPTDGLAAGGEDSGSEAGA